MKAYARVCVGVIQYFVVRGTDFIVIGFALINEIDCARLARNKARQVCGVVRVSGVHVYGD